MKKIIFFLFFLAFARLVSGQMVHFYIVNANTGDELTSKNGVSIILTSYVDYSVLSAGGNSSLNYRPSGCGATYSLKYFGSSEKKEGTSFYVPKLGIENQTYFATDLRYIKNITCEVKAKGYKTATSTYPPTSSQFGDNKTAIVHSVTQNGEDVNFEIALLPVTPEMKK